MSLRYLSVCSGIEAASVAWAGLNLEPVAFAEIDAFPCAVLAHYYPAVPNWGDLTKFKDWPDATLDLLVGGTPCQSFSVAGLRAGLADPRGNLALTYLAVVDRYRPRWVVWENVPGVLSADEGRAFGAFLGGLGQLGYGFAYRVLDAQYFGLAQRRKRVFVVGHLGDWRRAAAVLFERASLSGHPAPRREAREGVAPTVGGGPPFSRTGNERSEVDAYVPEVSGTLGAGDGARGWRNDLDQGVFVPEVSGTLGSRTSGGRRTTDLDQHGAYPGQTVQDAAAGLLVPYVPDFVSQAMSAKWAKGSSGPAGDECANLVVSLDLAPTLRAGGHDGSHPNGGVMPAIAFYQNEGSYGSGDNHERAPTLKGGATSNFAAVAYPIIGDAQTRDGRAVTPSPDAEGQVRLRDPGLGIGEADDPMFTLQATKPHAVAFNWQNGGGYGDAHDALGISEEHTPPMSTSQVAAVATTMQVRRLTPRECERLQGFPDDYTRIPYRGKPAADGPRYKALGNSMAVPVMRWIGLRIQMVEELP